MITTQYPTKYGILSAVVNLLSLIRKFLRQTHPCAPMLYDFNNIPIVWMHVRHSIIVSHFLYVWTMLEDVYFTNTKHILRGNPHTISINPISPTNLHTISYLKLVFIDLVPPPALNNIQFIEQIINLLMNSVIH